MENSSDFPAILSSNRTINDELEVPAEEAQALSEHEENLTPQLVAYIEMIENEKRVLEAKNRALEKENELLKTQLIQKDAEKDCCIAKWRNEKERLRNTAEHCRLGIERMRTCLNEQEEDAQGNRTGLHLSRFELGHFASGQSHPDSKSNLSHLVHDEGTSSKDNWDYGQSFSSAAGTKENWDAGRENIGVEGMDWEPNC